MQCAELGANASATESLKRNQARWRRWRSDKAAWANVVSGRAATIQKSVRRVTEITRQLEWVIAHRWSGVPLQASSCPYLTHIKWPLGTLSDSTAHNMFAATATRTHRSETHTDRNRVNRCALSVVWVPSPSRTRNPHPTMSRCLDHTTHSLVDIREL
jgi:hypothetical protein